MGARRAVELALAVAKDAGGARVFSLGELVHNPKVLGDLEKLGIIVLDALPSSLEGASVIIRAHGVSPDLESDILARGGRVVDATCPIVKECQRNAAKLARGGYRLFLAGKADHAEIEGILGYAKSGGLESAVVVENAVEAGKEAKKLYSLDADAKTALLGQTTISVDEYRAIAEKIKLFFPNVNIIETICSATALRQNALRELMEKVDAVIIAGGRKSANTLRLLAIARDSGKPCALAEDAGGIPIEFFNYGAVGISAGASTPDQVIDEIERELLSRGRS